MARIDIIHGHSSHHAKGIEVYKNKLILYGCGDFLNDYEGIGGYEPFKSHLCLIHFANVEKSTGHLISLDMIPMQIKRFRVNRATETGTVWLKGTLDRESKKIWMQHGTIKGKHIITVVELMTRKCV
jgi:poly-gamma-glutamate capsule biosynthesis protein CapA/YwtB (metallophosphatase superfamily)